MKKIISILLCLTMLLGVVCAVSAASTSVTITFDDTANRTVFNTEQQVWVQNGITVTNDKADSTSNVADYSKPARFYKSSTLTVAYTGMNAIEFDCNNSSYATALQNSIGTVSGATVTVESDKVTVSFATAVDTFTISLTGGQVRMDGLTVTAGAVVEHVHDNDAIGYDDDNHWTICTCGDESTKTNVASHTLVNHICACGYVATPTEIADIIACAYSLNPGQKIPGNITLTGEIVTIDTEWSTQYSNITVTIAVEGYADKPIQCFRLKSGDADASTLEVGDTITVTGTLMNYNGTVEFNSGCVLDAVTKASVSGGDEGDVTPPAEDGDEGGEGETPVVPSDAISAPEADVAYNMMINQVTNGYTVYLDGTVSGRYLGTTTDTTKAIDIYAEAAEGGYKFYTLVDGAKSYIEVYFNADSKVSVQYSTNGSVFAYAAETNNWVTNLDGTDYYIGTYSTFDTVSASKTSYISAENTGVSQFPAVLCADQYVASDDNTDTPTDPVDPPAETSDAFSSAVIALMAISAIGAAIVISKKKEF